MAFAKKNTLWQLRTKDGRSKAYETPEDLALKMQEYFDWNMKNPFKEQKVVAGTYVTYKKKKMLDKDLNAVMVDVEVIESHKVITLDKMRPLTIGGMCIFLGISTSSYNDYRKRDEFVEICTRADEIIFDFQLQGAASNFLNPSIIARKLGLVDKKDVTSGGSSLALTEEKRDARIEELIAQYEKGK